MLGEPFLDYPFFGFSFLGFWHSFHFKDRKDQERIEKQEEAPLIHKMRTDLKMDLIVQIVVHK